MLPDTLGVVGLGAVGGSVAWQSVRRGVRRVLGYCFLPRNGVAAVKSGAVSELVTDLRRVFAQSDLVILAAGPLKTMELLDRLAGCQKTGAFCTDIAPIKLPVTKRAADLGLTPTFAGSHPLIESYHKGFDRARPDRLRDRVVYVTPVARGDVPAREIADFWERVIGAHPVIMDPATHDDVIAFTSHLPRVVSAALAAALRRRGPKGTTYGPEALTATAMAAGPADLWADVLSWNGPPVVGALAGVEEEIRRLKHALERGDRGAVREWLEQARDWRKGIGS